MRPKRLNLFPNLPHRKSTFLFNPGEQILVKIKTIFSLRDIFGNDSKTFWFRFQNDIRTFPLSFLTLQDTRLGLVWPWKECPPTPTPESIATIPPFGPMEGQKWFDQISSQWESQKNRFAFISFGKIQFLPPCIWNIPFMSYCLCLKSAKNR